MHGYAIMRRVEEQTGGRLRLGPRNLVRFDPGHSLRAELIEEVYGPEDAEARPRAPPILPVDFCRP